VLELCVLGVLSEASTYGYAIAQHLADAGLGSVKGGTLYPLLARLETEGLVHSSWHAGEGGPGRKYFALTNAGRRELRARAGLWEQFVEGTWRCVPRPGEEP
jgi:PadR family transcriptional regulator PadR